MERSKINLVIFSRDREGKLRRRLLASFDILVSNDGPTWKTVKKVRPRKAAKKPAKAPPVERRCPPAKPGSPNVVLIFSDDLGYSDLPKFGKSEIPTPNIDRLAQEGTLFTNACVTAPITVEPDGVADAGFVLPSI